MNTGVVTINVHPKHTSVIFVAKQHGNTSIRPFVTAASLGRLYRLARRYALAPRVVMFDNGYSITFVFRD